MFALTQFVPSGLLGDWAATRGLNWQSASQRVPPLSHQKLGAMTLITLRGNFSAMHQRKALARLIGSLSLDQQVVVLDISAVSETDPGLSRLLGCALSLATRCRMQLVLAGVSKPKLAYLELTRLSDLLPCYATIGEAIRELARDPSGVSGRCA